MTRVSRNTLYFLIFFLLFSLYSLCSSLYCWPVGLCFSVCVIRLLSIAQQLFKAPSWENFFFHLWVYLYFFFVLRTWNHLGIFHQLLDASRKAFLFNIFCCLNEGGFVFHHFFSLFCMGLVDLNIHVLIVFWKYSKLKQLYKYATKSTFILS